MMNLARRRQRSRPVRGPAFRRQIPAQAGTTNPCLTCGETDDLRRLIAHPADADDLIRQQRHRNNFSATTLQPLRPRQISGKKTATHLSNIPVNRINSAGRKTGFDYWRPQP
jgi:hypothetical protein